jgi:hypothetical protein
MHSSEGGGEIAFASSVGLSLSGSGENGHMMK